MTVPHVPFTSIHIHCLFEGHSNGSISVKCKNKSTGHIKTVLNRPRKPVKTQPMNNHSTWLYKKLTEKHGKIQHGVTWKTESHKHNVDWIEECATQRPNATQRHVMVQRWWCVVFESLYSFWIGRFFTAQHSHTDQAHKNGNQLSERYWISSRARRKNYTQEQSEQWRCTGKNIHQACFRVSKSNMETHVSSEPDGREIESKQSSFFNIQSTNSVGR